MGRAADCTTLEFRVWSHHTLKADALLGKATVDLKQVLLTHNRKLEKVKEQLKLSLENKNGIVQTGELTVVLDGLVIEQEPVTNRSSSPPIEIQQNGDALHENGDPATRTTPRLPVEGTIGIDNHVSTNTVVPNSCCSHVVNGENTPSSPSQVAEAATADGGAASVPGAGPKPWQVPASASEVQIRTPRVNCPEKVIICLDLSEEMSVPKLESFNGSRTNALNVSQKMVEMFVRTKHKIDKSHEFALVVVNDDSAWLSGLTSDPRELCSCLYDLETASCSTFNLEGLFSLIQQKTELPVTENVQTIPPPYVVRTILVYSRPTLPAPVFPD